MSESQSPSVVTRPAACPFCRSKIIDTLAKVISAKTLWRCRACDGTWTIASRATPAARPLSFR